MERVDEAFREVKELLMVTGTFSSDSSLQTLWQNRYGYLKTPKKELPADRSPIERQGACVCSRKIEYGGIVYGMKL